MFIHLYIFYRNLPPKCFVEISDLAETFWFGGQTEMGSKKKFWTMIDGLTGGLFGLIQPRSAGLIGCDSWLFNDKAFMETNCWFHWVIGLLFFSLTDTSVLYFVDLLHWCSLMSSSSVISSNNPSWILQNRQSIVLSCVWYFTFICKICVPTMFIACLYRIHAIFGHL